MNIMMLLEMAADTAPDRLALGSRLAGAGGLTYGELFVRAGRASVALREAGTARLIYTDTASPALPVALFGASWAGIPFVPVSYRLADDRLASLLERQAPAVALVGARTIPAVDGIEQRPLDAFMGSTDPGPGHTVESSVRDWSYDGDDVSVLLHTSGTTADPKVAVLRQRHLVSYVFGSVEFLGADESEATLVSVPPYHIAGTAAMLTAVYGGRRLVQLPEFTAPAWVATAAAEGITHAMVVPTMLARILEELERTGTALPDLRHLAYGGGRMPLPIVEKALALLPQVSFVNAYGLTETSSSITVLGPDDHREALASDDPAVRARLGSVGRALPTVELSIRDLDGGEVAQGERGEVWVRGEQVSGEYGGRSVLNDEGWFPTKDAGFLDVEGYLFLDGRIDDVIVRGGENLSPGEIEDVLMAHPHIRDAVVLGVPDTEWGEVVAAALVLHDGKPLGEDDVRVWVTSQLRSSRAPALVVFRDELPYSDTGKVLRRVLKPELVALWSR